MLGVALVWGFAAFLVFGYTIRPYQEDAGLCTASYPLEALLQAGIAGLGLAVLFGAVVRAFEGGSREGGFKRMSTLSGAAFALLAIWVAVVALVFPAHLGSTPCP